MRENVITCRLNMIAFLILAGTILLPIAGNASSFAIFEVNPGPNKGLYYRLADTSRFNHFSKQ